MTFGSNTKFAVCFERGMLYFALKGLSEQSQTILKRFLPGDGMSLGFGLKIFREIYGMCFLLKQFLLTGETWFLPSEF